MHKVVKKVMNNDEFKTVDEDSDVEVEKTIKFFKIHLKLDESKKNNVWDDTETKLKLLLPRHSYLILNIDCVVCIHKTDLEI